MILLKFYTNDITISFYLFFIVKKAHQMSFEGFTRYLCSSDCQVFNNEFGKVYQDMHHPLKDYFISSSHNTYLLSDQLVGRSDVWGYVRYLIFKFITFKNT